MPADLLEELARRRDEMSRQGKGDAALRLGATLEHYRKLIALVEPSGSPSQQEQLRAELDAQLAAADAELGESAPAPLAAVSITEPVPPSHTADEVAALAEELRQTLASWRAESEDEAERLRTAVTEQAAVIERIRAEQRQAREAIDRLSNQIAKATAPKPRRGFWSRVFHRRAEDPF